MDPQTLVDQWGQVGRKFQHISMAGSWPAKVDQNVPPTVSKLSPPSIITADFEGPATSVEFDNSQSDSPAIAG